MIYKLRQFHGSCIAVLCCILFTTVQAQSERLSAIIPDFKVNEDSGLTHTEPDLAILDNGNIVIIWSDTRNGDFDVYAQVYTSTGTALGGNFRVNDDTTGRSQFAAAVASRGSAGAVMVWRDERNGDYDIYAQYLDVNGAPLGTNFRVNDDISIAVQRTPDVAALADGRFVVAWEDQRRGVTDIFAQRFAGGGQSVGGNIMLNDAATSQPQQAPRLALYSDGGYMAVWYDLRNGNSDIQLQRVSATDNLLGTNILVNDDNQAVVNQFPQAAIVPDGRSMVVWHDLRNGSFDIYAQRYDANGLATGTNFQINDNIGAASQVRPSISSDAAAKIIVSWSDTRHPDGFIYAQRYEAGFVPLGNNFPVNEPIVNGAGAPEVMLRNDRIHNVWINFPASGEFDVWANVLDWTQPVGIGDQSTEAIPQTITLEQNYPNPFNPATNVGFAIRDADWVRLVVYDLVGSEVVTLVNRQLPAGRYTMQWDGRSAAGEPMASGVYFYRLQAGKQVAPMRRMLLVR